MGSVVELVSSVGVNVALLGPPASTTSVRQQAAHLVGLPSAPQVG